uniref:Centrosomal protein of 162 kDa n=1 Tax=Erpetoichthys calabaricus TaxID=27687 RepID=A0A8C4RGH8_ERPCA
MEEIIRKRHPNSLPALIYAAASATSREVEGADKPNSVAFLERRIKKLEADLEGKDEDAKKSLRAMEQQFQKMKVSAFLVKANNLGANSENKESNYQPKTSGIEKKYLPDSKEDILQAENNVHNQHLTNQQMTTCHRAVKNLQKAEGHAINDFNSIDIERLQQELAMKNTKIQELAKTVEVLQKERRTLLSNQTKVEKIWEKKTKPSKADRINTESSSTQYLENPEPFPATLDEKCYQPNVFAGLHISDVLQENEKLKLEIEQLILETEKQKVTLQAALVLLPYSTGMNLLLEDTETYAAEHISCLKVAHQKELERIITQHALEHSSSKVAELTNKVSTQEIMIHFLQNQVADLQRSKEDLAASKVHGEKLQKQVAVLEEELEEAKQKYSPELKHFLALERKIKNMELRHAQREQELQKVIQQTHCTVDSKLIQENEKWKRLAQNKSNELEMFRIELDSILDVLRELQKQGVVIPEPSVVGTFSSKVTGNI